MCCVYRQVLYNFLQQSSVSQQLVVDRRVLQQHWQDLSQLWQLFLTQISNTQQLQNHPQQTGNRAQRRYTSSPNCLPVIVVWYCIYLPSDNSNDQLMGFIIKLVLWMTRRLFSSFTNYSHSVHTFCGWYRQVPPAAGWWAEPAGWGSTETRSAVQAQWEGQTGPVIWIQLSAARPPYCQAPPPTWSKTHTHTHNIW